MPDLLEEFDTATFDERLQWMNPPSRWSVEGSDLVIVTTDKADFWQRTHYGFRVDSGHFLFTSVYGDFECITEVRFHGLHQYDQAGLMVRVSADCWLKTSVEYEPEGPCRLGAVVTNAGYSDWSTQNVDPDVSLMWFRVVRTGPDYVVYTRHSESDAWTQIRLARLLDDDTQRPVSVGLYSCSPTAPGFVARFARLHVVTAAHP